MARAGDVERVQVALADDPVQVGVEQVQPGRRAPVPEQSRLDVLGAQRLAQQRVVEQVDLADGQVVRGPPVRVDRLELARRRSGRGRRRWGHGAPCGVDGRIRARPASGRRVRGAEPRGAATQAARAGAASGRAATGCGRGAVEDAFAGLDERQVADDHAGQRGEERRRAAARTRGAWASGVAGRTPPISDDAERREQQRQARAAAEERDAAGADREDDQRLGGQRLDEPARAELAGAGVEAPRASRRRARSRTAS